MKTRTVIEQIGENMGPIDWSYNFRQHFDNMGSPEAEKDRCCAVAMERLKLIAGGGEWEAVASYSDSFHPVVDVGMYDGWPYWKPVPSFAVVTFLGVEWHPFSWLARVRNKATGECV